MTHKETVERNIGLTFDFVNHLIDNKEEIDKLPNNFNLEFIEKDFTKIEHKPTQIQSTPGIQHKYVRVKNSFEVAL